VSRDGSTRKAHTELYTDRTIHYVLQGPSCAATGARDILPRARRSRFLQSALFLFQVPCTESYVEASFDCSHSQSDVDQLLKGYSDSHRREGRQKDRMLLSLRGNRSSFIETGTNHAKTLMSVLSAEQFDHVFSVEYSPMLHRLASRTVLQHAETLPRYKQPSQRVHLYLGDSGKVITTMLSDAAATSNGPAGAVCWLDAHYSHKDTAGNDQKEPPLMLELRAVLTDQFWRAHVVIIDDLRMWTGRPTNDHQIYPRPSRVHQETCNLWKDARFRVSNDAMIIWPSAAAKDNQYGATVRR
jgi:hypothetical protein